MCKMADFDRLLFGLLSLIFLAAVASEKVPVLIWGDQINHSFPKVLSGQTVGKETFEKAYLDEIANKKQNLVLFLQDKLSLDDITKYADVYDEKSNGATFKNLRSLMENYGSAQLPSVDSAANAMSNLEEKFSGKVHELKEELYSTKDIPLDAGSNFMVVHLPSTSNKESDFKRDLNSIDNIIGKLSSELKSSGKPFTAIYTALRNSHPPSASMNVGRHLLAASLNSRFINVTDCLLLYAGLMEFRVANTTWNLTSELNSDESACSNNTALIKLAYKSDSPKLTLNMELTFTKNMIEVAWKLDNWTVNYNSDQSNSDGDIHLDTYNVLAPLTFSYACFKMPELKIDTKKSNVSDDIGLKLKAFQVQPFILKNSVFGHDNNCIGFFSIGVWSMLVCLLVLLLILIPGVMMLSNIRVMDRFDDPKGKPVTINVLD